MLPHGPDVDAFERPATAELKPHKLEGTMAFMFETRFPQRVTAYAAGVPQLQQDYGDYGHEAAEALRSEPARVAIDGRIDQTHDPELRSWVASANGHPDFPIQNLPLGIFSPPGGGAARRRRDRRRDPRPRGRCRRRPVRRRGGAGRRGRRRPTLNALFWHSGAGPRRALRARLSELLRGGQRRAGQGGAAAASRRQTARCTCRRAIGDYTDFYVGIHHATNVGKLFRPDNPLLPNYKYVPIGYHGRASSIVPSGDAGAPPERPAQAAGRAEPELRPVPQPGLRAGARASGSAPATRSGEPIPIGEAAEHVAGFCLLNDWSARDIQAWEYQPLGPFLAKNFATHDLALGRHAGGAGAVPHPAAAAARGRSRSRCRYLLDEADQREGRARYRARGAAADRAGCGEAGCRRIGSRSSSTRHMYWTVAQMVAHHTSNGCNLRPGDLLGSGTISAPRGRLRQPAGD